MTLTRCGRPRCHRAATCPFDEIEWTTKSGSSSRRCVSMVRRMSRSRRLDGMAAPGSQETISHLGSSTQQWVGRDPSPTFIVTLQIQRVKGRA